MHSLDRDIRLRFKRRAQHGIGWRAATGSSALPHSHRLEGGGMQQHATFAAALSGIEATKTTGPPDSPTAETAVASAWLSRPTGVVGFPVV